MSVVIQNIKRAAADTVAELGRMALPQFMRRRIALV